MQHKPSFLMKQDLSDGILDVKLILYLLKRYWYIIITGIVMSLFAVFIINKNLNPLYEAQLKILINDPYMQTDNFINESDFLANEKKMGTEMQKIRSYTMTGKIISSLDYAVSYYISGKFYDKEIYKHDFPYTVKTDPSSLRYLHTPLFIRRVNADTCLLVIKGENVAVYDPERKNVLIKNIPSVNIQQKIAFGETFRSGGLSLTIFRNNDPVIQYDNNETYYFKMNDPNVLANDCLKNLSIRLLDNNSSILVISKKGPVIEKEIEFLNKLAELYINNNQNEQQQIALNTINYLDKQINETENKKDQILDSLNNFKIHHKISDFKKAYDDLNYRKDKLESRKLEIVTTLKEYNNLIKYISGIDYRKKNISPLLIETNDPQLNSLMVKLSEISEKDAELCFFSEYDHPQREFYKTRFNDLRSAIIEDLNYAVSFLNSSLANIENNLEEINTEIFLLTKTERDYIKIKKNLDFEEVIYHHFITKMTEADIALSSKDSTLVCNTILEKAVLSSVKQVFPQKRTNYIVGVSGGIVCSVVLIYIIFICRLKDTILCKDDVEQISPIPVIGSIGHSRCKEQNMFNKNMQNGVFESFRKLKTSLQYLLNGKETGIITITSSLINEGKTFNVVHLSQVLALSGKRTLLLEIDLRRPKIKTIFQSDFEKGLSNYLVNNATEDEIVHLSKIDNLFYIHSGPVPPNPNELLNNGLLVKLLNSLQKKFDYIIIDTPPIGLAADFFSVLNFTDICLYMVRKDKTKRNMLVSLNKYYNEKQIKNIQFVLNDFTDETSKYGYY